MDYYNSVNVKLLNWQLRNKKSATKNQTWITLGTSSNMIGNSYDEGSFTDKLLLNNIQVANLCKAFAINLLTNINHQKLRH